MSEQIFYSAEGMVEAAAEAQALVRAMEDTQSRFRTIKTMLNMSLSSVHELSITDRHVSFDKKNMQNQIDQMTRFADTLTKAAEYTDSTNGYIRDNLDFFMSLLVSSMGTGVLAQSSAWMLNQHQAIAEISGTLPVGTATTVNTPKKDPLAELLKQNPDYASSFSSLREYGYTDQQILDLANSGGLEKLRAEVQAKTLERLTAQMDAWYADMLEKNHRTSFQGACSGFVYGILKRSGAFSKNDPGIAAGGMYYDSWKKKTVTSTGYLVESVGKAESGDITPLEKLINDHPGEVLTNIAMSFKPPLYHSTYGHVIYINEVRDGVVYFTESQTASLKHIGKVVEGKVKAVSLETFLKKYSNMTGITRFSKPSE